MADFKVYQGRKHIDTVTYTPDSTTADEVRKSLVDRGEYPADIRVTKARGPAKTELLHVVQVDYGHGQRWEDVTASTDYKEAKRDLQAYRTNTPEYDSRLIKRRVEKGE